MSSSENPALPTPAELDALEARYREALDCADHLEWWCDLCECEVSARDVTNDERHDERANGCGDHVMPYSERAKALAREVLAPHAPSLLAAAREAVRLREELARVRGRLDKAIAFAFVRPTARLAGSDAITIQEAPQRDDSILWAVRWRGSCLNRDGEWEYEPMPSSRDDDFLARCRFATFDAAWAAAEQAAAKTEKGGAGA